jgi:hypothetical protein
VNTAAAKIAPAVEYSIPLGIFSPREIQTLSNTIAMSAKRICGLPLSTPNIFSHLPHEAYGLNIPHLQDSYISLAGDLLMDRLEDEGDLGTTTRKLIRAYIEKRGGALHNKVTHPMSSKSCILAQIRTLHNAGFHIEGHLDTLAWNTRDPTTESRINSIPKEDNGLLVADPYEERDMQEMTPLWDMFGILFVDELIAPETERDNTSRQPHEHKPPETHMISIQSFTKNYKGIKREHIKALKILYTYMCEATIPATAHDDMWTSQQRKLKP